MSMPKAALLLLLAVHGYLTFLAWGAHGYAGFFPPFAAANTTQIFSDLAISLGLVNVWVFYDLRRHRRPIWWCAVHAAGSALSGSFAPMVYLLVRDRLVTRPTCDGPDFPGAKSASISQSLD